MSPTLPVVVVESHQHVLEHIHDCLRRYKLLGTSWSMLHIDAHEDLSCPSSPAALCFQPRPENGPTLYETLDETSTGIAEWILPLVLGAHLRRVEWIRPGLPLPGAIPLGDHCYQVGVWMPNHQGIKSFLDLDETARVRVDFDCPYYRDDACEDSFQSQLVLASPLLLQVRQLPLQSCDQDNRPWLLDICLDYFCCQNPYLVDLQAANASVAEAMSAAIRQSVFYDDEDHATMTDRRHQLLRFRRLLTELLESIEMTPNLDALLSYYKAPDKAMSLLTTLVSAVQQDRKVVAMAVEAISFITMPHSLAAEWKDSLNKVREELLQRPEPPFLVTVARSAEDGFTPQHLVEDLQAQVLTMVHECYCTCERLGDADCRLQVVRDYGEWQGATIDHGGNKTYKANGSS